MLLRRIAPLCLAMCLGCSPDGGGLPTEEPGSGDFRAIHIVHDGVPLAPVIRSGALGGVLLDVVLEDAGGVLHPRGIHRVTWGSTNPGVADGGEGSGATWVHFNRNGEAKIIAHAVGLRDTVTFQIAQVAVKGTLVPDTVFTLSADARDLSGAVSAYHGFRYAAIRVDSTGNVVDSREPLRFDVLPDGLVEIEPESVGDTVAIFGNRAGAGIVRVWLGDVADSLVVRVADAYRVVRFVETPSHALSIVPDTVRIPRGAAVVFQNETRHTALVQSLVAPGWSTSWIRPNGRRARIFATVGAHEFSGPGGVGVVIVTP